MQWRVPNTNAQFLAEPDGKALAFTGVHQDGGKVTVTFVTKKAAKWLALWHKQGGAGSRPKHLMELQYKDLEGEAVEEQAKNFMCSVASQYCAGKSQDDCKELKKQWLISMGKSSAAAAAKRPAAAAAAVLKRPAAAAAAARPAAAEEADQDIGAGSK
eukprot:3383301-Pyramimonas_sp.AAC.1